MRLVIDTNVMVAALQSDAGMSRALLEAALDGRVLLLLSTPLVLEYEAVLTRPEVLAASGLDGGEVRDLLDDLCRGAVAVGFDFRWRPVAADPADDLVVETAVNGVAAAIASFNLRDMAAGAALFGIPVLRPGDIVRRLRR